MELTIRPTYKQHLAYQALSDSSTKSIVYGGAAGGGKSWIGCEWLLTMCIRFPKSRWFIGREELKRLRESTLMTFFKVSSYHGTGQMWSYNAQDHYIKFYNGSRIDMLELKYLPSDPMFERYGSMEFTGGWIEEGGEVHYSAYDVLKTRIGRCMNDVYGLNPAKLLITCNPKKNWIYFDFYKPHRENALPPERRFIKSLVTDNPYIESQYIENLRSIGDKTTKERLLFGNFEYDDDPAALLHYDSIIDMFAGGNNNTGEMYITCDVARYGNDKTVIFVWDGYVLVDYKIMLKSSVKEVANSLYILAAKYNIPPSRIVADEDGVGGGVVDIVGCKGFVNNSSPMQIVVDGRIIPENFENLKAQCTFKMCDDINAYRINLSILNNTEHKDMIIEEAEQVKQRDMDKDGKKRIMPKEKVKEIIGRSPDYWDAIMMRKYFDLAPVFDYGFG